MISIILKKWFIIKIINQYLNNLIAWFHLYTYYIYPMFLIFAVTDRLDLQVIDSLASKKDCKSIFKK